MLLPSAGPVLDYCRGEENCTADAALGLSCMVAGSMGYGAMTLAVFAAAVLLRTPVFLVLLPVWLILAAAAALGERRSTRFVGLGALVGAVTFWTIGWALGLFVMISL